jgi:putative oxygen-independent coproporphyrinogen III oxidase
MPIFNAPLPLSLYIHLPWCVRKCPYCDFNSHEAKGSLPEELYVSALMQELELQLPHVAGRPLVSIFFGGGTPSLFSAKAIGDILEGVQKKVTFTPNIEITLEANPGTMEQSRFHDFRHTGINRLSIGIQSLQNDKLKTLGRIHDCENARRAIQIAKQAGFDNFNVDIMYGLPDQSIEDALHDINTALAREPTHFSWYQLTIEPNTLFHHQRPTLPNEDILWEMQLAGQACIREHGFSQYEVSAYSQPGKKCLHNKNYWEFGDYLGIGAGAHSKMTDVATGQVQRFAQVKNPRDYLDKVKREAGKWQVISDESLMFEFMLNSLRLTEGVSRELFSAHTGLPIEHAEAVLKEAELRGLLVSDGERICPTMLGQRYLDNLVGMFLS